MTPQQLLQNINLQTFDLPMTVNGFYRLKSALENNVGKPQIYIHVGDEGLLKNEVLRIGSAKNGTRTRWYATDGHESTFLWSIGESERYRKYASAYPHYLTFFAGLYGLNTKLHVLTCESPEQMLRLEKKMSKEMEPETFHPIWESYRDQLNGIYFRDNPKYRSRFSAYGGALDLITRQRDGETPLNQPVPDVLDFRSNRKWNSINNER